MNKEELKQLILKSNKGTFHTMIWNKELKLLKKFEGQMKITKISKAIVRFGCQYDNLKAVQDKRENGELPEINQGLNGLEWLEYPIFLRGLKNNNVYLRVNLIPDTIIETKYYLNGNEVTKDEILKYCLASNFSNGKPLDVFNVNIDNIQEIN